ncbi:hypothetical protein QOZ80_1BG0053980 [Eleusine coracana subsp. coracana]|nr:hypothetical protein QOZ80_1BG0053980 [Eleusine coracana subsp. coracana]
MCERPRRHLFTVGALIRSSQLLTIVAFSSLWSCAVPTSTPSNNDFETLICLKLHLSTSTGPLDSWNRNSSLHFCSWPGVTCSKAHTSRVIALVLESSSLDGQIPPCIGNLTLVTKIHFSNNHLKGVIPPELGQLRRLRYLNLSSNSLIGTIPNTLSSTSLQVIDLGTNSVHGEIPEALGMLSNISVLNLADNRLTGNIPLSLGTSSSLVSLVLANNSLTGSIPSTLVRSSSLEVLDLTRNTLGGVIPPGLFNSTSLQILSLGWNYFVGSIPSGPLNIDSPLRSLVLSVNKLIGTIPSSLDDGMDARLSDFGLAKFIHHGNSSSNSTASLGPRGSIGYIAPEYGFGNKISTEGDVYSYGILILEMLTAKRPTDELFSNGLSLHKFVGDAFPERISEILDPNITRSLGDVGLDNKADKENHAAAGLLGSITQFIKVGLSCSMEAPKDRPTMLEVYAEVNAIKQAISAVCVE